MHSRFHTVTVLKKASRSRPITTLPSPRFFPVPSRTTAGSRVWGTSSSFITAAGFILCARISSRARNSKARAFSREKRWGLSAISWHSLTHCERSAAGGLPLAGHRDQLFQGGAGVGHDAVVGREDPADLGRLDVHVHEGAAGAVGVQPAGLPVGPPVADAEDEVGGQHGGVAVLMGGLQAGHARHQRVVVRDGAPAHQGRDDRHVQQLGQLDQQVAGVGVDDAAAGHDHRPLAPRPACPGPWPPAPGSPSACTRAAAGRCPGRTRSCHLHVERQVDQHRAGPAGAHQVERLLERAGHLGRLQHGHRHLRQRFGDGCDVDSLEVLLVQPGDGCLAGDAQDRDRVRGGRVQAGDHVGAGRAGGADTHADVAGLGPGVALGHVRGTLDVPGQDVLHPAVVTHGGVERVDGCAGQSEDGVDAFLFQDGDGGVDGTHGGHCLCPCQLAESEGVEAGLMSGSWPESRSTPRSSAEWSSPPSPLATAEPISWATTALFCIAIRKSCCIAKSNFISDSIFLPNVWRYNIDNICYSYKDHKSYQCYKSYL